MSAHNRSETVSRVKTLVVKIGTNVLSTEDDQLDADRIAAIAEQVDRLCKKKIQVAIVSSGAVGAGMGLLKLKERPKDLAHLQAAAATGQAHLIHIYDKAFRPYGFHAAQLLLTANDFKNRSRYLNVRNTLRTLSEYRAVPIINENDSVSTEEIKLGDNDRLAAMVAGLIQADLLIILSVVDGLLTGDPKDPKSERIPLVERFDESLLDLVGASKSSRGTGGMRTKLDAVHTATAVGVNVIIADGRRPNVIDEILSGADIGTLFLSDGDGVSAWKRWIGYTMPPQGRLVLDQGARRAVEDKGKSVLAIGVVRVEGQFVKGEVVSLVDQEGDEFARGLTNYDSASVALIAGKRKDEINRDVVPIPYDEVIHRDNLVVTSLVK